MSNNITGAMIFFTNLALYDYPDQHVGNLSTTYLKSIKIIQQGYVIIIIIIIIIATIKGSAPVLITYCNVY